MIAHDEVYNLTVLADRFRPDKLKHELLIMAHDALSATLLRPKPNEPFEQGQALSHTIYVVIAGFGSLGSGDADDGEATAGDVLFVPAGTNRRFTKLSRKFQVWRLTFSAAST